VLIMVQLSPSHTLAVTQDSADGEDRQGEQLDTISSPKVENLPEGLTSPLVSLEMSTAYHGYETYIEDGLICLKHKVRNLEKKKLKLKDYQKRLSLGEVLNKEREPRGSYIPPAHLRESVPLLYPARDSGYQHVYRRGGGRHSSAAWSDSSQVSSPDRDGAFTVVDSGHGDSLSVSTVEVPLTPHSHPPTALLPMPLYPLSQPLRVAFTASRTANFAPGNLDQPIVFDQLHSNLGEMYDTHIGRFTCPANGTYVFIFHILKLAISVPLYVNLMRNEEVMVSAYANDGAPDHETASNHAILPLFQGDQVWLRLHRGAIYGSTWKYSTFSGFLLYQD
uniref:Caprin family member 2 n=1 Tax=Poecilia formosa TaxID=48698 RepID=A0A096LSL3_POEFO